MWVALGICNQNNQNGDYVRQFLSRSDWLKMFKISERLLFIELLPYLKFEHEFVLQKGDFPQLHRALASRGHRQIEGDPDDAN